MAQPLGDRIPEFDVWRPGYQGSTVEVLIARTTNPAALFTDPELTQPAPNPQVLDTYTDDNGAQYGRWQRPIYTAQTYTLLINHTDETGIVRPSLGSLDGLDLSTAVVSTTRGKFPVRLSTLFDYVVNAASFGPLSDGQGSEENTATLRLAVGAAAAVGGGVVVLPPGGIGYNALTLPEGVILRGAGAGVTTLRTFETQPAITLGGDGAGLQDLTLDGVNVITGSIGVYGVGVAMPVLDRVLIQRFDIALRFKGINGSLWTNVSLNNNNTAADFRGDADAGQSAAGAEVVGLRWDGGFVSLNITAGVVFDFFDKPVRDCSVSGVTFASNTGPAVSVVGARGLKLTDCDWISNLVNLSVLDGTDQSYLADNTARRIILDGGTMDSGECKFNGACEDVQLRGMTINGVSFNLNVPKVPILLRDCTEDAATTATGDTTKLLRSYAANQGMTSGVTTDGTAITAWSHSLAAGATCFAVVKAIGRRRDGDEYAVFHLQCGAHRPGFQLPVSGVSPAFTKGKIVRGVTSGANARITAVDVEGDFGGTITLRDLSGLFINGEQIIDDANGTGRVSGEPIYSGAVIDDQGVGSLRVPAGTGVSDAHYAVTFDVVAGQLRVRLAGAPGHIVEWTVDVTLMEP
jgi:hypothetical protein